MPYLCVKDITAAPENLSMYQIIPEYVPAVVLLCFCMKNMFLN